MHSKKEEKETAVRPSLPHVPRQSLPQSYRGSTRISILQVRMLRPKGIQERLSEARKLSSPLLSLYPGFRHSSALLDSET